jgi:hypothetical protein
MGENQDAILPVFADMGLQAAWKKARIKLEEEDAKIKEHKRKRKDKLDNIEEANKEELEKFEKHNENQLEKLESTTSNSWRRVKRARA